MFITILIALLTTFLQYLFTKWLQKEFGGAPKTLGKTQFDIPTREELIAGKPDFLDQIGKKRHFLLGWNRVQKASVLFDKAMDRYQPHATDTRGAITGTVSPLYYQSFYTGDFKMLASGLTAGLTYP